MVSEALAHLKAMKHAKRAYYGLKQVIASYHNHVSCHRRDLIEKAIYDLQIAWRNTEALDGVFKSDRRSTHELS